MMSGEVKKLSKSTDWVLSPLWASVFQWILFGRVLLGVAVVHLSGVRRPDSAQRSRSVICVLYLLDLACCVPLVTRCLPVLHSALLTPDIVSILLVPGILWGKPNRPLLLLLLLCTFWVTTSLALLFLGQGTLVNQEYSQRVWPRLCVSVCHSPAHLPLQPLSYKKLAAYLYALTAHAYKHILDALLSLWTHSPFHSFLLLITCSWRRQRSNNILITFCVLLFSPLTKLSLLNRI